VTFESEATNLVAGDENGVSDIFVRDNIRGVTTRMSVSSAGSDSDGSSTTPALSADGRFVVFESQADNLAPGDTNGVH
jgi:Tol biopolymer transport system component